MKLIEKILLCLFGISYLLHLTDSEINHDFFLIIGLILVIFYFFFGIVVLRTQKNENKFLLAFCGVIFAIQFFIILLSMGAGSNLIYKSFSVLGFGLCLFIGYKFSDAEMVFGLRQVTRKLIFGRSLTLSILVTFMVFLPFYQIAKLFDKYDPMLYNHALMIHYTDLCKEAIKKNDLHTAMEDAEKSFACLNEAILVPISDTEMNINKIEKIFEGNPTSINANIKYLFTTNKPDIKYNSSYSNFDNVDVKKTLDYIGFTYYSNAVDLYNSGNYNYALHLFLKSALIMSYYADSNNTYNSERLKLINMIADCNNNKKQYWVSDSLLTYGLIKYKAYKMDSILLKADFFYSYAELFRSQEYYDRSNKFAKVAILMLSNLPNETKYNEYRATNNRIISYNYSDMDSIGNAEEFSKKSLELIDENSILYPKAILTYGTVLYKIGKVTQADSIFRSMLKLKEIDSNIKNRSVLPMLALTQNSIGKYDTALFYINKSIKWMRFYGNVEPTCEIIAANILVNLSDYQKAKEIYESELLANEKESKANLLINYSALEITLSNEDHGKFLADEAMEMIKDNSFFSPSISTIFNAAAYANYCNGLYKESRSLYEKAITVIREYNQENTRSASILFNGLALTAMAEKKYLEADTLFAKAIDIDTKLNMAIYPEHAKVLLNLSSLRVKQARYTEAETLINNANKIALKYLKKGHDFYGDLNMNYGDLYFAQKQFLKANNYYSQALNIYSAKFNNEHVKVRMVKAKIAKCGKLS